MSKSKWGLWLLKLTVNAEIDKAHADLKAVLVEKGFKVIKDEAPNKILVKQGSLWGMSPKTAKKTIEVTFAQVDYGTQVTCSSRLSSDWKNLTLAGCALAAALVGLCVWMMVDLNAFMVTLRPSFWSWLVTANGGIDVQVGKAFVNLAKSLAVFLSVIIFSEALIVVYVHAGMERFVQGTINSRLIERTIANETK